MDADDYPALRRQLADDDEAWAELERLIRDVIEREHRERETYRDLPQHE